MHDWSLLSLTVEWKTGEVRLDVQSSTGLEHVRAVDLYELCVPRGHAWGPSVSINAVEGPKAESGGRRRLTIEMQSGDRIEIVAGSFEMPGRAGAVG